MIKTAVLLILTMIAFVLCMQAGFVSLLSWMWLSVMMPQSEAWNSAALNYSNLAAGTLTVIALITAKDKKIPPLNIFTTLFFIFTAIFILSQIFSLDRELSAVSFRIGIATLFMTYAILTLVNTKVRIQAVLWIFVLSTGYYGVTRGLYTIATAGAGIVIGPANTIISDNNQLAVGLAMMVPLAYYLFRTSLDKRVKVMAAGISALSIIAVIGSHSRGGLISLGVLSAGLIMRSKKKLLNVIILLVVVGASIPMMPAEWFERMETISNAEEDASFMGRVEAWEAAYKLSLKYPILGLGSRLQYLPEYNSKVGASFKRATHNAYLEILAGHGYLAFGAFLGMMAVTFFWCRKIRRLTKNRSGFLWANDLAGMLQLSLMVYGVGVMALSMEFWIGLWLNMVLVFNLREIVLRDVKMPPVATAQKVYA